MPLRWCLLGFFVLSGCLPDLESIHGERILYEHSASAQMCNGTVAYLDRAIPFLERQLGVTAPAQLRYSWLIDSDEISLPSAFTAGTLNWTIGGHTSSYEPALLHEVVHLVAASETAPFFGEGVAVAYDSLQPPGYGTRYRQNIDFDPRRTMAALSPLQVDYAHAGLFVMFLLTRHGPAKFRAFYTRLPHPATMTTIRTAFSSAYGADLDDEVEAFMAGPPRCESDHFMVELSDCSAPLIEPYKGSWSASGRLACDSPTVVGGTTPTFGYTSFRQFTLEIEAAGTYELKSNGNPDVWVRFGPCFGCVWDERDVWFRMGETRAVDLEAGKHFLRISGDSAQTPSINVILKPA